MRNPPTHHEKDRERPHDGIDGITVRTAEGTTIGAEQ